MYIIKHQNGLYFHNKGRIILFERPEEAQNFLEMFIQYSTERLLHEGNLGKVMEAQMLPSQCSISIADFDIDNVECGTVLSKELFEGR